MASSDGGDFTVPNELSRDHIDTLHDEELAMILAYLNIEEKLKLEIVCKRWQRLIFSQQYKLTISRDGDIGKRMVRKSMRGSSHRAQVFIFDQKKMINVLKRFKNVKNLTIDAGSQLDTKPNQLFLDRGVLSAIGRNLKNVETISFGLGCRFDENAFARIGIELGKKNHLKKVILYESDEKDAHKLENEHFQILKNSCKNLEIEKIERGRVEAQAQVEAFHDDELVLFIDHIVAILPFNQPQDYWN